MAGMYGDFTAGRVNQGFVRVPATAWTVLSANGSTPLPQRRHVRIFVRSKPGNSLGIAYSPKNADGTFTTPTDDVGAVTVYPGNTRWVEPVSDKVQVYGRLIKKAGSTDNNANVIVTEYA